MGYLVGLEVTCMYCYKDDCFFQHNDVSFSRYTYTRKSLEHKHDFFEIAYVAAGQGRHFIDGRVYDISEGDYMIIDTTAAHCYDGNVEIANIIFNLKFLDKNYRHMKTVRELYSAMMLGSSYSMVEPEPLYHVFHDDCGIIERIMNIKNEIESKPFGFAESIRADLLQIMILSVRKLCREDMSGSGNCPVQLIEKYIYDHYDENISLSELCADLGYSLPYISKRFKAVTGYTFSDYLQKTRIHFACRFFINSSDGRVEDIAAKVGYSDIKYFTSVFKKFAGITPGAFCHNLRKDKTTP